MRFLYAVKTHFLLYFALPQAKKTAYILYLATYIFAVLPPPFPRKKRLLQQQQPPKDHIFAFMVEIRISPATTRSSAPKPSAKLSE